MFWPKQSEIQQVACHCSGTMSGTLHFLPRSAPLYLPSVCRAGLFRDTGNNGVDENVGQRDPRQRLSTSHTTISKPQGRHNTKPQGRPVCRACNKLHYRCTPTPRTGFFAFYVPDRIVPSSPPSHEELSPSSKNLAAHAPRATPAILPAPVPKPRSALRPRRGKSGRSRPAHHAGDGAEPGEKRKRKQTAGTARAATAPTGSRARHARRKQGESSETHFRTEP